MEIVEAFEEFGYTTGLVKCDEDPSRPTQYVLVFVHPEQPEVLVTMHVEYGLRFDAYMTCNPPEAPDAMLEFVNDCNLMGSISAYTVKNPANPDFIYVRAWMPLLLDKNDCLKFVGCWHKDLQHLQTHTEFSTIVRGFSNYMQRTETPPPTTVPQFTCPDARPPFILDSLASAIDALEFAGYEKHDEEIDKEEGEEYSFVFMQDGQPQIRLSAEFEESQLTIYLSTFISPAIAERSVLLLYLTHFNQMSNIAKFSLMPSDEVDLIVVRICFPAPGDEYSAGCITKAYLDDLDRFRHNPNVEVCAGWLILCSDSASITPFEKAGENAGAAFFPK